MLLKKIKMIDKNWKSEVKENRKRLAPIIDTVLLKIALLFPMYYTKHRFSLIMLFASFSFFSVDTYHLSRRRLLIKHVQY